MRVKQEPSFVNLRGNRRICKHQQNNVLLTYSDSSLRSDELLRTFVRKMTSPQSVKFPPKTALPLDIPGLRMVSLQCEQWKTPSLPSPKKGGLSLRGVRHN